jgi:hypothetical protein
VEAIEMLDLALYVEATQDAFTGTRPTVGNDDASQLPGPVTDPQPPILITEHEVMFGTTAAVAPRSTPVTRRMIGTLRIVAVAMRPPPPRPHYAHRAGYLERACMSREMGRL